MTLHRLSLSWVSLYWLSNGVSLVSSSWMLFYASLCWMLSNVSLCWILLSWMSLCSVINPECHYALSLILNVITPIVIIPSVIISAISLVSFSYKSLCWILSYLSLCWMLSNVSLCSVLNPECHYTECQNTDCRMGVPEVSLSRRWMVLKFRRLYSLARMKTTVLWR